MDALARCHPEHFSSHDAIFRQLCVSVYQSLSDHISRHLYNQHFVVKLVQDHVARCFEGYVGESEMHFLVKIQISV